MSKYWFLFFCAGVWACNETPKDKKADVVSDSVTIAPNQIDSVITKPVVTEKQSGSNSVMECDQALNLMFQTSNFFNMDDDPKNQIIKKISQTITISRVNLIFFFTFYRIC